MALVEVIQRVWWEHRLRVDVLSVCVAIKSVYSCTFVLSTAKLFKIDALQCSLSSHIIEIVREVISGVIYLRFVWKGWLWATFVPTWLQFFVELILLVCVNNVCEYVQSDPYSTTWRRRRPKRVGNLFLFCLLSACVCAWAKCYAWFATTAATQLQQKQAASSASSRELGARWELSDLQVFHSNVDRVLCVRVLGIHIVESLHFFHRMWRFVLVRRLLSGGGFRQW